MSSEPKKSLSQEDLEAEGGDVLPAKEVMSVPLLDLDVNADLALALAAPIDLAVAGNLNVAAPIDAAASANVLSAGSSAAAVADQGVLIDQLIDGEAIALADQDATLEQGDDATLPTPAPDGTAAAAETPAAASTEPVQPTAAGVEPTAPSPQPVAETTQPVDDAADRPQRRGCHRRDRRRADAVGGALGIVDPQETVDGALDTGLLDVDVNIALDADVAAPIAGAVAVNANVAAPIDAAVAANIGTIDSEAVAIANQQAIITQHMDDVTAEATAEQDADVKQ